MDDSTADSAQTKTHTLPHNPCPWKTLQQKVPRQGEGGCPPGAHIRNLMSIQYCRHIKINGERCGSPALTNELFCYYHVELKRRHHRCKPLRDPAVTVLHPMSLQDGSQRDPILAEPLNPFPPLDLPQLEDRHSIQVALSLIVTALAQYRIDPKLATLLFYGLQVASTNAHKLNPIPKRAPAKVSLTILDEANGNLIAPAGDPEDPEETQDYERKGSATRYWEMLQAEDREETRLQAEKAAAALANLDAPLPPPL